MEVKKKAERTRCTLCKRHIRDAQQDQILINAVCETNLCQFTSEIRNALLLNPPRILSFYSSRTEVQRGEDVSLFWNVINIREVNIEGLGNFPNEGNITLQVTKSEKYKLKIIDFSGNLQEEVIAIKVLQKPIISLKTSNEQILKNGEILISWSVTNAQSVFIYINEKGRQVNLKGSLNIKITRNTTIRLLANGKDNLQTEKYLHIESILPASIQLKSNYNITIQSQPVRLTWIGKNYTSLQLYPANIELTNSKYIDVYPSTQTTYRLVATNTVSQAISTVVIDVMPLPSIQKLEIPKIDIKIPKYTSTNKDIFLSLLENKILLLEFVSKPKISSNPITNISLFNKIYDLFDRLKMKTNLLFLRKKI